MFSPAGGQVYVVILKYHSKIHNTTLQKLSSKTEFKKKKIAECNLCYLQIHLIKRYGIHSTISEHTVLHSIIGYLQLQRREPRKEPSFSFVRHIYFSLD